MNNFDKVADEQSVQKTVAALKANGMNAIVVESGEEAKKKVLELIPKGAEVMDMSSITLETLGLDKIINESGDYSSVKNQLASLDREKDLVKMLKLGAAPEWAIGSVHAITEDGHAIIASNTGSQLPAYVYGAANVIWVVGTQKVVENDEVGIKRLHEYIVPKEAVHMEKKYGRYGTNVSKLLIFNKEIRPNRVTVILVKEVLGY